MGQLGNGLERELAGSLRVFWSRSWGGDGPVRDNREIVLGHCRPGVLRDGDGDEADCLFQTKAGLLKSNTTRSVDTEIVEFSVNRHTLRLVNVGKGNLGGVSDKLQHHTYQSLRWRHAVNYPFDMGNGEGYELLFCCRTN